MTDRRLTVAVGVVAMAGGLAVLFVPGVGGVLPGLLAVVLTVGVGAVALWLAASQLFESDGATVRLPTPESRPTYRPAGAAFAGLLDAVTLAGRRELGEDGETGRERLYERLHELAVAVLSRTDGWPPAAADERLADGSWTDDADAAAFFRESLTPPVSRRAYLPWRRTDLPVARRARRVVAALAERVGGPTPETDTVPELAAEPSSGPYWPTADLPHRRSTGLTRGVTAAALAVSAVGVGFGRPAVVLTATLGIALVGAARVWSPAPSVALTRSLSTASPAPGEHVTVTVTVRNTGDRTLPDIRLLDGVPAGLTVVDGNPRVTTALRPGKAVTFSYEVGPVPGRHRFEPGLVILGDPVGAAELVTAVDTPEPTTLDCGFGRPTTGSGAPRPRVTRNPGQREGDASGAGVEFDAIREYRTGDPPARIDWNRRAKTGELSTVEFREPRVPKVAVLVDARPAAYVAGTDGVPAPRHAARGAHTVFGQLLRDGVPTGVGTVPPERGWLQPGTGAEQRRDARDLLAGDAAVPWVPPSASADPATAVTGLTARLDPDTQVVFLSPCADDGAVAIARRLDAEGHSVTVVSPDCTDPETVTGAYGRLTRWLRHSRLRAADVPVSDWDLSDGEEVGLRVQ